MLFSADIVLKSLLNDVAETELLEPLFPVLPVLPVPVDPELVEVLGVLELFDELLLDEPHAATPILAATASAANPALPLSKCTNTSCSSPPVPSTGHRSRQRRYVAIHKRWVNKLRRTVKIP
jgi:hypothetical protein